jgi:integrase
MRKTMTDRTIATLKPRKQRYAVPDPLLRGHYVRVSPSGGKTFVAVARHGGRQVWATVGDVGVIDVAAARERARSALVRIKDGLAPFPPPAIEPDTFRAVAENWHRRHVVAKGLRTGADMMRLLERLVFPAWGHLPFIEIKRRDVAALLDRIEDECGAPSAHRVLRIVGSVMTFYAQRDDTYVVPIVRGMARISVKERARDRILNDDELRAVWSAAEASGTFGALVKLLLLTGQRREKVRTMRWNDLAADAWNIPAAPREKSNAEMLVLPPLAMQIIAALPRVAENPYVLTASRGGGAIRGLSEAMRVFRAKLPPDWEQWQLHDLRRTARSLMSRAGVDKHIAEITLGHTIGGVAGIYDRHTYVAEKRDALERLASLVRSILDPQANVIALPAALANRDIMSRKRG